ncbi:hypothetical protein BKA69DRAFT_776340 [Paraphysoderma sedebokerense]|nr:hypothetical protein BKA69DRAFT_776340 [Paraphysoderma sedebokerense]
MIATTNVILNLPNVLRNECWIGNRYKCGEYTSYQITFCFCSGCFIYSCTYPILNSESSSISSYLAASVANPRTTMSNISLISRVVQKSGLSKSMVRLFLTQPFALLIMTDSAFLYILLYHNHMPLKTLDQPDTAEHAAFNTAHTNPKLYIYPAT